MNETAQAHLPIFDPRLTNRFHAVCVARGITFESGFNQTLDFYLNANNSKPVRLQFHDPRANRVQKKRPSEGFTGEYVARYYPRSHSRGGTQLIGCLVNLLTPQIPAPENPRWSVTGKVVRLDRADRLAIVRVYRNSKLLEPFTFTARTSLELIKPVEDAWYVHMTGTIIDDHHELETIEPVEGLRVPGFWRSWRPKIRREIQLETEKGIGLHSAET
jgi:hypothetical protein